MKSIFVIISIAFLTFTANAQSGQYAGNYKKWIKKEVVKAKEAVFFKGFIHTGFMLLQSDDEIEYFLQQYKKGSTHIILLISHIKDALSYTIEDVLEIKQMAAKDNIQSGNCTWQGSHNAKVIVLENNTNHKPKNTKAWYADTDKLRFVSIATKGINCIIEGAD